MEDLINPTNASERQVLQHLEVLCDGIVTMHACGKHVFRLKPQGNNTVIEKEAVNLMEITVGDKKYIFGGITENFYDEVCDYFVDLV